MYPAAARHLDKITSCSNVVLFAVRTRVGWSG
jgi:hypothetical protein